MLKSQSFPRQTTPPPPPTLKKLLSLCWNNLVMNPFYATGFFQYPLKYRKTLGFPMLSGRIEKHHNAIK